MKYELEATDTGWIVRPEEDLVVEVDHPVCRHGVIHAALSVRRGAELLYRDSVNLTSARARKKLVEELSEKEIELGGDLLIALDEACRQPIEEEEPTIEEGEASWDDDVAPSVPYRATKYGLSYLKATGDGVMPVPLTNFTAEIVGELVRDDGVETQRCFELGADLAGRRFRFDIPAAKFPSMQWVTEKLGPTAVLYAGFGAKDHARAAIQLLSGEVSSKTIYTHLGWRRVDGQPCYLHAGGAIGTIGTVPGIEIDTPDELTLYALPGPPEGEALVAAIRASLQMLDVLPVEITIPVYCAIWRAAVGPCDFAIHLAGQTGAGKSEVAAQAQQHYGAGLNARHLPGSWSSTANALEALAFTAKDALLVVDDFAPEGSQFDIQRKHRDAARLLRAQGNRTGRQRMRRDSSLQPTKTPRGLILSTGEDIPKDHSIRARTLLLEVPTNAMDWNLLTKCQERALEGVYAQAFAGYVRWLAQHHAELEKRHRVWISARKGQPLAAMGGHRRTTMIEAELSFGLHLFLQFAVDARAMSADEADRWMDTGVSALRRAAAAQTEHLAAVDPVQRFLELLQSALGSGSAHLASVRGEEPEEPSPWGWRPRVIGRGDRERTEWQPQGQRIGWIDEDDAYLEPDAAYRAAMQSGDGLTLTTSSLWKRLREARVLASTDASRGRNTIRKTLEKSRRQVLHLSAETLMPRKPSQSSQSSQDDENSGPSGPHSRDGFGAAGAKASQNSAPAGVGNSRVLGSAGTVGTIGTVSVDIHREERKGESNALGVKL